MESLTHAISASSCQNPGSIDLLLLRFKNKDLSAPLDLNFHTKYSYIMIQCDASDLLSVLSGISLLSTWEQIVTLPSSDSVPFMGSRRVLALVDLRATVRRFSTLIILGCFSSPCLLDGREERGSDGQHMRIQR